MEGWICPRCGRANAPSNMTCSCADYKVVNSSNMTITTDPINTEPTTAKPIGGWVIDERFWQPVDNCADWQYLENLRKNPVKVLPKEESKIVVEAKPQLPYNEVIAPLREKIMSLKRPDPPLGTAFEASVEARREAYNLAIDDILEMLDEEKDKTVVIEITAPCNHRCDVCEKKCKEKKVNE